MVIGGTHPAGLAADWLTSARDQNSGLSRVTPAHSAVEDVASTWLVDRLGLPAGSAVGFVTGAPMVPADAEGRIVPGVGQQRSTTESDVARSLDAVRRAAEQSVRPEPDLTSAG